MKKSGVFFLLFPVVWVICLAPALAQVVLEDSWTRYIVEDEMQILPLADRDNFGSEAIVNGQIDDKFKSFDLSYINGRSSKNWLKFTISNPTRQNQEVYLGTSRFEYIECWVVNDSIHGPMISGQNIPDDQKIIPITGYSFFVFNCPPGSTVRLYLKVVNENAPSTPQVAIPFTLCTEAYLEEHFKNPAKYTYMFVGASLVMLIFNILLFLTTRLRSYLYYSLYLVCITGYMLGIIPQFAYPLYGHMNQSWFPTFQFATLASILYMLVGKDVMEIKTYFPRINKIINGAIIAHIVALLLYIFPDFEVYSALLNYPAISIGFPLLIFVGFKLMLRKHLPGTLFFFASFTYLSGVMVYISQLLGLLSVTLLGLDIFTIYQIAVSTEFALASLSLGARINEMRKRIDTEKQAMMANQNEILEKQVSERTSKIQQQKQEIEQQRDHLEQTLIELNTTQAQLIHREKLASLGELSAGIAHEIQNPLNFINNFSEVSADLLEDLKESPIVSLNNSDSIHAKEILEDLTNNLQIIQQHGQRADAIVRGLIYHTKATAHEKEPTHLNDLVLEYFRLAYQKALSKDGAFHCELIEELDPDLKKITIVAPEIGRVLLNLYNNAFYAVTHQKLVAGNEYVPTVWICTKKLDKKVEIRVKDNGIGMSDEVKSKVFQPFFTTKPTGQGTGLGLSLSYDIITKGHSGEIRLFSETGNGTTFVVELPLD